MNPLDKYRGLKVALVYDRVNKWGGAERVLLELHKIFPDAPIYTSVYSKERASWVEPFNIKTSFLQNFPFSIHHELYALLMPIAFESFTFDEYDLVISVTSESAKGIITKPKTAHICYCLTPTRYLWSGYNDYFVNPLLRFFSAPAISYLRTWDRAASSRPDLYIAISGEVQKRIKTYYGIEARIVYPPASFDFSPSNKDRGYFLIVSRLVPYKRIGIAIAACNKLRLPLKIVGTGYQKDSLKRLAGPTIEFLGSLTDRALKDYYRDCKALLFPGYEDFGLSILEAQSFAKPVIAFAKGGAMETVIKGKTGEFFYNQDVDSLTRAIEVLNNSNYNREDFKENLKRFDRLYFRHRFLGIVAEFTEKKKL